MISIIADINQLKNVTEKIFSLTDEKHLIILLNGTLASGKTTLVKAIAKYLDIKDEVTSPTFAIQTIYNNKNNKIYHYDIYNKSLEEFISLGFLDELDKPALHIVEWGDIKLKNILIEYGFNIINVDIKILNKDSKNREYKIYS